jgi:hypothetical protein
MKLEGYKQMNIKGMTFYRAAAITNREKVRQQKWQEAQKRKKKGGKK